MDDPLTSKQKENLLQHLLKFVSENKKNLFYQIIQHRTRHLTVVLDDIYQPHNASAVLRTCDCFGIQDVHIIESKNPYEVNPDVALGSSKWLTLIKYRSQENNLLSAYKSLRENGYNIIATTPHKRDVLLNDLDISNKTALVFGNELSGLSGEAIDQADGYVKIPMVGFTESFNISVSAAIILNRLTEKLWNSTINWQLTDEEKTDILLNWCKKVVKRSELLEEMFRKNL